MRDDRYYSYHEADGGANDEGYHRRWCSSCYRTTEHEPTGHCCVCGAKNRKSKSKRRGRNNVSFEDMQH